MISEVVLGPVLSKPVRFRQNRPVRPVYRVFWFGQGSELFELDFEHELVSFIWNRLVLTGSIRNWPCFVQAILEPFCCCILVQNFNDVLLHSVLFWLFAPILAIYMRNFAYLCINGLDSYSCT